MARASEYITAIDVGSSKVCAVIGQQTRHGVDVIGFGTHESRGLRKGVVADIETTAACVRAAVEEAELMAGCEVRSAYFGVSAGHHRGRRAEGLVNVHGGEVTEADIARVLDAARRPGPGEGQVVLHTLVRDYLVDEQHATPQPIGASAARLRVRAHLVMASATAVNNLARCASGSGVEVEGMVLETLASSHAVLDPAERDMGCVLVDIGGGTTDVAIWSGGSVVHTAVVPYGGDNITRDLAIGLSTTYDHADRLKELYGCALTEMVDPSEFVEVPGLMGRPSQRKRRALLATVIEPRLDEILRLVRREVELSGYGDSLRAGYVLTGGTLALPGALELAERTLGGPVRIGVPVGVGGLLDVVRQPKYAAAVGLLLFVARHRHADVCFRMGEPGLATRLKHGIRDLLWRLL